MPAEELADFNAHIIAAIEVLSEHREESDRDWFDFVSSYLAAIDDEGAWFALIGASAVVVPQLMNAYDARPSSRLVEIIWQHRRPSTIPFLASVAAGDDAWSAALDGLVVLQAMDALRTLLTQTSDQKKREWIAEAIEQTRES